MEFIRLKKERKIRKRTVGVPGSITIKQREIPRSNSNANDANANADSKKKRRAKPEVTAEEKIRRKEQSKRSKERRKQKVSVCDSGKVIRTIE